MLNLKVSSHFQHYKIQVKFTFSAPRDLCVRETCEIKNQEKEEGNFQEVSGQKSVYPPCAELLRLGNPEGLGATRVCAGFRMLFVAPGNSYTRI